MADRAQVIAVFARERDRARAAPSSRVLGSVPERSIRVSARLMALGAAAGFAIAAVFAPATAWVAERLANEPGPQPLLLAAVSGLMGALLGAIFVWRTPRAIAGEVRAHLERGRVVALLAVRPAEAHTLARRLEAEGALEALPLPRGLELATLSAAAPRNGVGYGATFLAGHKELPSAAARLEGAGVRVALLGRDGHAGPVHSSTAGPGWIHSVAPEGGEGWWRTFAIRRGRPIRLSLADGELVLLGDAQRIALCLSGHRNDTVASALARLAERFGCPDASARIVTEKIDQGGIGLVVFGPLLARRHAVERLAESAVVSSEGASTVAQQRGAA